MEPGQDTIDIIPSRGDLGCIKGYWTGGKLISTHENIQLFII